MPKSLWNGNVSVGLLNIPVKLVSAVRQRPIRFHLFHARDRARLRSLYVCRKDGETVPREETVKGYELRPGEFVTFTHEELEAIETASSPSLEIDTFIPSNELPAAYLADTYALVPQPAGGKAYQVLLQALAETGKAALGRLMMRGKDYLVALRPQGAMLQLTTLHGADEIVPADEIFQGVAEPGPASPAERDAALTLIERLSGPFDPDRLRSRYDARLRDLIAQKAQGRPVQPSPPEPTPEPPTDLLRVLEASLEQIRRREGQRSAHGRREGNRGAREVRRGA